MPVTDPLSSFFFFFTAGVTKMIHPEVSLPGPLWWQSEKLWMCRLQQLPVKGSESAALKHHSATENIRK